MCLNTFSAYCIVLWSIPQPYIPQLEDVCSSQCACVLWLFALNMVFAAPWPILPQWQTVAFDTPHWSLPMWYAGQIHIQITIHQYLHIIHRLPFLALELLRFYPSISNDQVKLHHQSHTFSRPLLFWRTLSSLLQSENALALFLLNLIVYKHPDSL